MPESNENEKINPEENKKKEEEKEKEDSINSINNRQKRKEAFLTSLESGVSILKASKGAGIDYKTIWNWRKDDEEFNEKVIAVLDSRIMIVEDALFLNAAKGNLGAQIFWLKNRSQGRWKDKTEGDINLALTGGLDFKEYKKIKEMNEDERKALIADLSKLIGNDNIGKIRAGQSGSTEKPVVVKEDSLS